ncbi:hypothetical protein HY448_01465 [Candidatus Pacearchaeota archaeon]|nr:hypothetical protein [Candidatus Pacearchaeota archaeon]
MFNFKKLSAIGTSALMMGLTVGTAAAANYPAPFVVGGNADVAIVYGTGSGVSLLDSVEAGQISTNLQSFLGGTTGGTTTSTSGETVSLDTSADRIWLNTSLNSVKSTLTKSDLPTVLADSNFDGDTTSDLTPTIKLLAGADAGGDNSGKVIFAKQPKSSVDPQVGISLGSSQTSNPLYNASVTFSKAINFTHEDSEGETVTLFGKDFVVSTDTDLTDLVLFASAREVTLTKSGTENPSATVNVAGTDYTVSLLNGDSTSATVQIGTDSKEIDEGDSKKVGGIEVAVKDVTSSDVAGITATLLVGSEKLTITNGATVTRGADDDPIDGTHAYIVGGTAATTEIAVAVFRPDSSNDAILPGTSFQDPVFESFKVDFVGLSSPLDDANREMISVLNSGDDSMTITFTDADGNSGTAEFAKNATYASNQADTPIYKQPNLRLADDSNFSIWTVEGANLTEDDYVVLGNEEYGHLLQLIDIYNDTSATFGDDRVEFQDVLSGTTYKTTFTSSGVGTLTIDGKQYTVLFAQTNGLAATIKYPTSDSATVNTWVVYPTIETDDGAQVQFYEPLNVSLDTWNGTSSATKVINFPDGDGYTPVTFTYQAGGNATFATWTVSGASASVTSLGTASNEHYAYANYTVLTVGSVRYNVTGLNVTGTGTPVGNAVVNRTEILLIDPEGNANIDQPAVVVYGGQDEDNNYHAVVVDLETAPAGSGDSGLGVNDVLFSSDKGHYSASLQSDSDITQDLDWWGTLVTIDATESDQKTVEISYPESQVYAQIYIGEVGSEVTAGTTSSSGATQLGNVLVMDTEVSSVQSKNLIVVGGTCINSVAAEVLGGSYCGAGFTDATGVGSGQFLIQSVGDAYTTGKVALVVAGYEVADTVNAATYLRTQTVDTAAGKKYVGTTSTSAELQVA